MIAPGHDTLKSQCVVSFFIGRYETGILPGSYHNRHPNGMKYVISTGSCHFSTFYDTKCILLRASCHLPLPNGTKHVISTGSCHFFTICDTKCILLWVLCHLPLPNGTKLNMRTPSCHTHKKFQKKKHNPPPGCAFVQNLFMLFQLQ